MTTVPEAPLVLVRLDRHGSAGHVATVSINNPARLNSLSTPVMQAFIAAVQGLTQHALNGSKAFAGATNLQEAMVVQVDLTRASVQLALGEGAKLQHAALKLTERACTPLLQRATAALEQTKISRAA